MAWLRRLDRLPDRDSLPFGFHSKSANTAGQFTGHARIDGRCPRNAHLRRYAGSQEHDAAGARGLNPVAELHRGPKVFAAPAMTHLLVIGEPMSDDDTRNSQSQDQQRSNDHFEGRAVMKRDFSQPVSKPARKPAPAAAQPLDKRLTEQRNPRSARIDQLSTIEIVDLINAEDRLVAAAVGDERHNIARAIDMVVDSFRRGGRLLYVGAGSSGRLGVLD